MDLLGLGWFYPAQNGLEEIANTSGITNFPYNFSGTTISAFFQIFRPTFFKIRENHDLPPGFKQIVGILEAPRPLPLNKQPGTSFIFPDSG